ncbi:MAG: GNAT family N-acetyltransferase [Anaerolineae bacterium]
MDIVRLTPRQMEMVIAIYREAFEAPWEMPVAELADFAAARAGESLLGRAVAAVEDGEAVGLALSSYLARSNLLHLKYLAVAPGRRNRGVGSLLLRDQIAAGEAIARAAGRAGCRGILLEVETPDGPPPDADRDLRRRRIAFYHRHGALSTGIPFPRPPSAPPEQPDWELMLLPGSAWRGALAGPARRELARALLVEGYRMDEQAAWLATYLWMVESEPD